MGKVDWIRRAGQAFSRHQARKKLVTHVAGRGFLKREFSLMVREFFLFPRTDVLIIAGMISDGAQIPEPRRLFVLNLCAFPRPPDPPLTLQVEKNEKEAKASLRRLLHS